MGDDYDGMARLMRVLDGQPASRLMGMWEAREASGLPNRRFAATVEALGRRGWVTFSGTRMHVGLSGLGRQQLASDPAQLLALDVLEWTDESRKDPFGLDDLPPVLRADVLLLAASIARLESHGAVRTHRSSRGGSEFEYDRIWLLPGARTFAHRQRSSGSFELHQHVAGDFVGGNKVVNSDQGIVVIGDANAVQANADIVGAFQCLLSELRDEAQASLAAIETLARASDASLGSADVAEVVRSAVEREPRLATRLKSFFASLATSLAGSALYDGIKMYLVFKGLLLA